MEFPPFAFSTPESATIDAMNEHHYSRIDAGQSRQSITKPIAAIPVENPDLPSAKAQIVAQAILDHSEGKSLRQIAQHLDVSYEGLRIWMLQEQPANYKAAQELGLISRIVYADKELDDAANSLDIARARETGKFARWDAERRLPHLFGQKQEVTHKGHAPVLSITIVDNSGKIVDNLGQDQHSSVMLNTPELPQK